jgi:hypothetical protein
VANGGAAQLCPEAGGVINDCWTSPRTPPFGNLAFSFRLDKSSEYAKGESSHLNVCKASGASRQRCEAISSHLDPCARREETTKGA